MCPREGMVLPIPKTCCLNNGLRCCQALLLSHAGLVLVIDYRSHGLMHPKDKF